MNEMQEIKQAMAEAELPGQPAEVDAALDRMAAAITAANWPTATRWSTRSSTAA